MILPLIIVNPVTFDKEVINIKYPEYTYNQYCALPCLKDDNDICKHLYDSLQILDVSRLYDNKQVIRIEYPIYKILLSEYFYWLIKIQNIWLYNMYAVALIKRCEDNILYEYLNKPITVEHKVKKRTSKPNKYIKHTTKDLFTGKDIYIYTNYKTGDEITSSNPNLLEELNAKKKKIKKTRVVPAMTFKFKMN